MTLRWILALALAVVAVSFFWSQRSQPSQPESAPAPTAKPRPEPSEPMASPPERRVRGEEFSDHRSANPVQPASRPQAVPLEGVELFRVSSDFEEKRRLLSKLERVDELLAAARTLDDPFNQFTTLIGEKLAQQLVSDPAAIDDLAALMRQTEDGAEAIALAQALATILPTEATRSSNLTPELYRRDVMQLYERANSSLRLALLSRAGRFEPGLGLDLVRESLTNRAEYAGEYSSLDAAKACLEDLTSNNRWITQPDQQSAVRKELNRLASHPEAAADLKAWAEEQTEAIR